MDDFPLRLAKIQDEMAAAAKKSARDPSQVELIAVTKTHPVDAISEAMRTGVMIFGESKVQEARGKIDELGRGTWHLIGHLQSNKVRDAVRLFDWIDSV